jgi:hypothetical protein
MALETPDALEAMLPDCLPHEAWRQLLARQQVRMDAHHQNLLVVRTIENADTPSLRQAHRRSPKEIMIDLLRARSLERVDDTTLRIDARHDVLDDAVLAGGIHALQHDQDRPFVLGVELFLKFAETLGVFCEQCLDLILVELQPRSVSRIEVRQAETIGLVDAVALDEFCGGHVSSVNDRKSQCDRGTP